jgi:hypothetical protein
LSKNSRRGKAHHPRSHRTGLRESGSRNYSKIHKAATHRWRLDISYALGYNHAHQLARYRARSFKREDSYDIRLPYSVHEPFVQFVASFSRAAPPFVFLADRILFASAHDTKSGGTDR